jgi:hypothetical protein
LRLFVLRSTAFVLGLLALLAYTPLSHSQENPYIVAYDHNLEKPGSLEVDYLSAFGTQRGGPHFHAYWAKLESGATTCWASELCLVAQTTFGDNSVSTRFRAAQLPHKPRSKANLTSPPTTVLRHH